MYTMTFSHFFVESTFGESGNYPKIRKGTRENLLIEKEEKKKALENLD